MGELKEDILTANMDGKARIFNKILGQVPGEPIYCTLWPRVGTAVLEGVVR